MEKVVIKKNSRSTFSITTYDESAKDKIQNFLENSFTAEELLGMQIEHTCEYNFVRESKKELLKG